MDDHHRHRSTPALGSLLLGISLLFQTTPLFAQNTSPSDRVLNAAQTGDLPTVKAWVEQHPRDINAYGWETRTLLLLSAGKGHLPVVDFLLKNGANPNLSGDGFSSAGLKQTPLHVAAWHGNPAVIGRLLEAKAEINPTDAELQTPLHLAVLEGKEASVLLLLKAGANIHAPDRRGISPYRQALTESKTNLADLMLTNVSPINAADDKGNTPLHLAVSRNNASIIDLLLRRGASIDATNGLGLAPLHLAIDLGYARLADLLLKHEARVDLYAAAGLGRRTEVEQMLQKQAGLVTQANRQGRTALHWAAASGQSEMTMYLLNHNAQAGAKDIDGASALDLAAKNGHAKIVNQLLLARARPSILFAALGQDTKIVSSLLSAGANIGEKNSRGQTPLHLAVLSGNPEMVQHLLTAGADVNAKDANNATPLDLATRGRNDKVINQLLGAKPKLGDTGKKASSPLHLAIQEHKVKLLADYVKVGADLEARNAQGQTPLLLALNNNNIEAMDALLKLGANIQTPDPEGQSPLHLAVLSCFEWSDEDAFPADASDPAWVKWGNRTGPYLLAQKADVKATNNLGRTPFHMVGLRGEVGNSPSPYVNSLVTNLLAYGGNINSRDSTGLTPLHLAVQNSSFPLVEALLAHGADPNIKDNEGRNALHTALNIGTGQKRGIPRAILDTGNSTRPLSITMVPPVSRPPSNILRLLLRANANINATDNKSKTPLQIAVESKDPELIKLLQTQLASPK